MTDAAAALQMFAAAPLGTGLHLRARPGPMRDRFIAVLRDALPPGTAWRTCPASVADDRLLGGLDLAATLATGRATVRRGLLADSDGGIVVVPGAERIGAGLAARLGAVLDEGAVRAERDGAALHHPARIGLLLLDEGEEDEVPAALRDRLAFRVELDEAPVERDGALPTGRALAGPEVGDTLVQVAAALGIGSARAVLLALRAARSAAVLAGRSAVAPEDTELAARLVLAHRATRLPEAEAQAPEPERGAEAGEGTEDGDAGDAATTVLAAIAAVLPARLLDGDAATNGAGGSGRGSGRTRAAPRGRPAGARPGRPGGDARLHLVATLMAAAPRQFLRQALRPGRPSTRLAFRAGDLRLRVCHARPRQTTLFVVDASGSAALHRLAEAKGAVELLLGECYVTRNQVGLIAFRGTGAELLLPPTRALARARRCLGALPGGGGTPLAAGLSAAGELAGRLLRRGEAPLLVVLTDGRGNVALDGTADRALAAADATAIAGRLRAAKLPGLLLDISPRPAREAGALAAAMGARYLPLPRADAAALSRAVKEAA